MPNKLSWCELTPKQKVILFLAIHNKPIQRDKLIAIIWALDKHFKCEAQEEQTRSTPQSN